MRLPLKRKFPRGKIDAGEKPEECNRREILEGMGIRIRLGEALPSSIFQYPALADTFTPLFSTSNPSESLEVVRIERVAIDKLPLDKLLSPNWAGRPVGDHDMLGRGRAYCQVKRARGEA